MDASKKNLSSVKGNAPIVKVGQTKQSRGWYGTDVDGKGMVSPGDSTDLNLK